MAHASGLQPIARRCPRQRHLPPAPDFHPHRNSADPTASGQPFCRQGSPTRRHGEPIQRLPTGWRTPRSHTGSRHSGRAGADELRHERRSAAMNSHELPRAQNQGAVAAVGITEYSMPPPEESSGGSQSRSRGKSRAENPSSRPPARRHRCIHPTVPQVLRPRRIPRY